MQSPGDTIGRGPAPARRGLRRRSTRGLAVLIACLLLPGCGREPAGPSGSGLVRAPLVPTADYRVWWSQVVGCSGISGDFDRLRFFEVVAPVLFDGTQFPCGEGLLCNGMWEAPHDITLAPAYVRHERLVKHEMLHDLLDVTGHPPVFETCGVTWEGGDRARRSRVP